MLTLDTLLLPLPHLIHPLLPSIISTLLLAYITYNPSHLAASPALTTLLYTTRLWNILTIALALLRTFGTWLGNIEGLERDGLRAVWHEVLSEGKMRAKRRERVVQWGEEIVLVTGGQGGLGRELVRVVRARGCRAVAVVDVVGEGGAEVRGTEGDRDGDGETKVVRYRCDVGDAKEVERLAERVGRDVCRPSFFPFLSFSCRDC